MEPELFWDVNVGQDSVIEPGALLGYAPSRVDVGPLTIGTEARIRRGTVIYGRTTIGARLETGHNVVIREENTVGDDLSIWNNSTIDYGCRIGNGVKIHHNVYVAQFTVIEDGVFLGPGVVITNDIHPGCPLARECMEGPVIKRGAQIGAVSVVLPRVIIGEHALVGAGSIVTRDVPAGAVVYGNPAKIRGWVQDMKCITGLLGKPYGHLVDRLRAVSGSH